jgi:peptidoglycan/LPS O-acetylase OafA/YrhL
MTAATTTTELEPVAGAPPAPTVGGRVSNVDILRALAALAVLAVHAYVLGGRQVPIRAQHWYDVPLMNLSTGVWLFFAISGYVIARPFVNRLVTARPLPGTAGYAARRALRIFPLYWVALTAVIAIDGSGGARPWQLAVHYLLLNNLVPGRQEALFPAAWTLTLEVLFYIAVPLLAAAVRWRRPLITPERLARLVILSWIASIVFTVIAYLQGDGEIGLWLRGSLLANWQMFCPGILLAIAPHLRTAGWRGALQRWPESRGATATAAVCLLGAAVLGTAAPLRFGVDAYQVMVDASRPLFAVGYGLVLAAAIRGRPWERHGTWLLSLGLASYGIYLLHPVIEALLLHHGWAPVTSDSLPAFALNTVVLGLLTVPVAIASWRWLERPALALAHGRRAPRR